jgi:hypothetical protein
MCCVQGCMHHPRRRYLPLMIVNGRWPGWTYGQMPVAAQRLDTIAALRHWTGYDSEAGWPWEGRDHGLRNHRRASMLAHAPSHYTRPSRRTDGLGALASTHMHTCSPSPQTKHSGLPLPSPATPWRGTWTVASRHFFLTPVKWRPPVCQASPPPHTIPAPIHAPTNARTEPPHPLARRLACYPALCPPARRAAGLVATHCASPPWPPQSSRPPPAPPLPHRCNHSPHARRACPPPT